MALKIRLRQQGRKGQLSYRLVLTDSSTPRDGKYLESLGWYDPHRKEKNDDAHINPERISHWIQNGAEPSEKSMSLIKRKAPEIYQMVVKKRLEKKEKERKKAKK